MRPPESRWRYSGVAGLLVSVLFWCLGVYAFGHVAPWMSALSVSEAEEKWPGKIDHSWRAVSPSHNRPSEWPHGTVQDNPVEFSLWAAALAVSVGWFVICLSLGYRESLRKKG